MKNYYFLVIGLILTALFLNIGIQPLFLEEPRRAIVAMEMMEAGNLWVPLQLGEYYYFKPPIYNWLIILSVTLFQTWEEWAVRIPSVLSFISLAVLIYAVGKRHHSREMGLLSALFFMVSIDILFYFSLLAEIDLFYSLITFGVLSALLHFSNTQQYGWMYLTAYLLSAVGFLTKGMPSIAFLGLGILYTCYYHQQWKKLFHPMHFVSGFLFLGIVGGYFLYYSQFHDPIAFLEGIWTQSSQRTVVEHSWTRFLAHILVFPIDLFKNTLPASLILLFYFQKSSRKIIQNHPFLRYSLGMLAVQLILYWLSPGAKQRYIYMLYPLVIYLASGIYINIKKSHQWLNYLSTVLTMLLLVGGIGLYAFGKNYLTFPLVWPALLSVIFGLSLAVLLRQKIWPPVVVSVLALSALRIVFDLVVLPQRATDSIAQSDKDRAAAIVERVKEQPLYLYIEGDVPIIEEKELPLSLTMVFYLNKRRGTTLKSKRQWESGVYYLANKKVVPDGIDTQFEHQYGKETIVLVQYP